MWYICVLCVCLLYIFNKNKKAFHGHIISMQQCCAAHRYERHMPCSKTIKYILININSIDIFSCEQYWCFVRTVFHQCEKFYSIEIANVKIFNWIRQKLSAKTQINSIIESLKLIIFLFVIPKWAVSRCMAQSVWTQCSRMTAFCKCIRCGLVDFLSVQCIGNNFVWFVLVVGYTIWCFPNCVVIFWALSTLTFFFSPWRRLLFHLCCFVCWTWNTRIWRSCVLGKCTRL